MSKIKITVLKVADPDEFLDELPVEKLDWMIKCPYYTEGQEFMVEKGMPEPCGIACSLKCVGTHYPF